MKKLFLVLLSLFLFHSFSYADTVNVSITDLNHDKVISENDPIENTYENGYYESSIVTEASVLDFDYATFDKNRDKRIQPKEYENYLNYIFPNKHAVTLIKTSKHTIKAIFFDINRNGYIDIDEPYTFMSKEMKEFGKIKSSLLYQIHITGFDSDDKITTIEMKNYLNSLKQFQWEIELINPPPKIIYDRYTIITDDNGNEAIDVNEKYGHFEFDASGKETFKESGLITPNHIDTLITNGFDINNDGLIQKEEFEIACLTLLKKKTLVIFVEPVIDTTKY